MNDMWTCMMYAYAVQCIGLRYIVNKERLLFLVSLTLTLTLYTNRDPNTKLVIQMVAYITF